MQKLMLLGVLCCLLLVSGCSKPLEIDGKSYKFSEKTITELTEDDDSLVVLGVLSDIHGETAKVKYFADFFKQQGVDAIIVLGDIASNDVLRQSEAPKDDKLEIVETLRVLGQTGLPIFVVPGNHESQTDYAAALREIEQNFPNVIDMTKYRVFNGDDVDLISLPGYQDAALLAPNGFWASPSEIESLADLRQGLDDSVVLITHGPPATGVDGPGTTFDGEDVGNELTKKIMQQNDIRFAISGHIHESGGTAATLDGQRIPPTFRAEEMIVNFGTLLEWPTVKGEVFNGMAGVFVINGPEARYHILTIKSDASVKFA